MCARPWSGSGRSFAAISVRLEKRRPGLPIVAVSPEIQAYIARVCDRPAFARVTAADAELAAAHEAVAKATG